MFGQYRATKEEVIGTLIQIQNVRPGAAAQELRKYSKIKCVISCNKTKIYYN